MSADDRRILKFRVPCYFGSRRSDIDVLVGRPKEENNPIHFQNKFMRENKGGSIPGEILDSLAKLRDLALLHGVSFQELCENAFAAITAEQDQQKIINEKPVFDGQETIKAQESASDAGGTSAPVAADSTVNNAAVGDDSGSIIAGASGAVGAAAVSASGGEGEGVIKNAVVSPESSVAQSG